MRQLPYVVGRAITIDKRTGKIDRNQYSLLPEGLRATSPDEVETVLWVTIGEYVACTYTTGKEPSSAFNPLRGAVAFYQGPLNHLAAVKKAECPMYPSCSEYSIQSFEKHGLFIGWIMTHDRLMRCGRDELKISPSAIVNGKWKCIDPVGNNDFWWYENMDRK